MARKGTVGGISGSRVDTQRGIVGVNAQKPATTHGQKTKDLLNDKTGEQYRQSKVKIDPEYDVPGKINIYPFDPNPSFCLCYFDDQDPRMCVMGNNCNGYNPIPEPVENTGNDMGCCICCCKWCTCGSLVTYCFLSADPFNLGIMEVAEEYISQIPLPI